MRTKTLLPLFIGSILLAAVITACAAPTTPPPPLATVTPTLFLGTHTVPQTPGAVTPIPGVTLTSPTSTVSICDDQQAAALIDSFKAAILNADGPLLGSLVSPSRGMDVAFFRDGTVITYTP